jgi:prepilin-type processing-associated H-X9-DG protein
MVDAMREDDGAYDPASRPPPAMKKAGGIPGWVIALIIVGGILFFVLPVLAGFLIPTLMRPRGKADVVRCQSNLREIQKLGMMYADTANHRFYPSSPKGGIGALQVIVDEFQGLKPSMFICGEDTRHEPAELIDGKFQLDEKHSSYEMVPWRLSPSDPPDSVVAFDREPWHKGGRNVVFVDNSIEFMMDEDFKRAYEKDRQRYEGRK